MIVLMENAVISAMKNMDIDMYNSYTVVCGVGNNGGDGLGIARHLNTYGKEVNVFLVDNIEKLSECSKINYNVLLNIGINIININKNDLSEKNYEDENEIDKIIKVEKQNIIKNKIEKGIKSFFIKLEDAFKDENIKEVNIFLAGNSCKHPNVNEIFKKYQNDMKEKLILNIFDLETIEKIDENNDTKKITGKTGVAYGLIYSRKGGRIKVTNRDEKENIGNEVNFKYYVGKNKRDKFIPMITPSSKYEEYKFYGIVISDTFEIYYTTSSEAQTGEMEIGIDNPKIKRIFLNKEYDEDEKYRIYIKANSNQPTVLHYVIVKKEEDIEVKEFLEENDISLD